MSRFGITAGAEIPEETVEMIRAEVIFKRARLRAMHLLEDMDRTEAGLREKLRQGLYPEDAAEEAVRYVKSFGYLDDSRYAENFVRSRQGGKSRREIQALLLRKGISADKIEAAFEACYSDDEGGEEEAVRKILKKKRFSTENSDEAQMQKIYAYLARKGFRYDTIRQVIQNYNENA